MFDDHASELKTPRAERCNKGEHRVQMDKGQDPGIGEVANKLSDARDQQILTIVSMHGGRHFRRQLMDMGLRPGLEVTVIRARGHGPVLISVGETRLGIGREMAKNIIVREA